jgi:NAD(P)-dependent dehydrogenase (short-subunit alcohol dehydrogenase family)
MTRDLAIADPELMEIYTKTPPLGRVGERDDLTAALVYLLSDASAYTTGADLPITGGLHGGRIVDRYSDII